MRLIREGNGVGTDRIRAGARAICRAGLLGLVLAGACSSHQTAPDPQQTVVDLNSDGRPSNGKTRVRVENQNLSDMTIYVYRGTQRMRLGRATGNGVTSLEIPKSMVSGLTELRFAAEPMGNQRGILSQPIPVNEGDLVDFIIPPR
jgi:hypothetical protein